MIVGNYSPESLLQDMQQSPGWSRTDYLGYRGRSEIGSLLAKARAGIVVLQPTQNLFDAFPTKLFEYMALGKPIVASRLTGIMELLTDGHDVTCFEAGSVVLFAKRLGDDAGYPKAQSE